MTTRKKIGDIVTFKRGYDLPSYNRKDGPYPIISSSGITGYHDEYKAEGEGLVTGRYGTLGEMNYINGKYWPHNTALYVTTFKGNYPKYVYFLLKTLGSLSKADKSAVPGINRNDLHEIKVPYIEKNNQKKIADILFNIEHKIEVNNRINAELEAMAKTLYDYWFVQFDFPDAEGNPYKTNGGKMAWNDELKQEVPEGWEVSMVGEVLKTSLGGTPSTLNKSFWTNGTINWLSSGEMNNFPIIDSNAKITNEAIKKSATKLMPKGTIAISITRYIRPTILAIDTCANQSVVGVCESEIFKNSYLYPYFKNQVSRYMVVRTGANQPHINKETIDESNIIRPTDNILEKYYSAVSPVYDQITNNAFQNQQLIAYRDWLLPMLMNGQIRVESEEVEQPQVVEPNETLFIADHKKPFAKQVLGGKIVSLFQNDPHFTNIKFQKLQYLAEHLAEVDLGWNYYYQAAGPYDNIYMHSIADRFAKSQWFARQDNRYVSLEKQSQIDAYYESFFKPVQPRLDQLFALLANATDIEAEIIATLYAVWNNRIILNQPVTEATLIDDFYNWSDRKLLYTQEQLTQSLQWMHTHQIIPLGFGKELKKAKAKK